MKFSQFSKLSLVSSFLVLSLSTISCSSTKKADDADKAAAEAAQKAAQDKVVDAASLGLKTVYFDFNKYIIRADQVASASATAVSLKANPSVKIQIQGNTDDRGSAEYNLALGNKRADALKKYLVAQGVSADNISTVSFGKERPAVQGHDEDSWAKNRRDDIVVQK
jgi:peptidoglycan-associated lipoprotein